MAKQQLLAALSDEYSSHAARECEGEVFAGFRACRSVDPNSCSSASAPPETRTLRTPTANPDEDRLTPLAAPEVEISSTNGSLGFEQYFSNVLSVNYSAQSPPQYELSHRTVSLILEEVSDRDVEEKLEECDVAILVYNRSDFRSVRYMRELLKMAKKPVVLLSMNNGIVETPRHVRCVRFFLIFFRCVSMLVFGSLTLLHNHILFCLHLRTRSPNSTLPIQATICH